MTIEQAAQALVTKMDEMHEHPSFKGMWVDLHIHGRSYAGPSYEAELAALKAALAAPHPTPAPTMQDEGSALTQAERDVIAERRRHVEHLGWTAAHDDEHGSELATAAGCYALYTDAYPNRGEPPPQWPWEPQAWKPKSYRKDCERAAALLIGAMEVIDRQSPGIEDATEPLPSHQPDRATEEPQRNQPPLTNEQIADMWHASCCAGPDVDGLTILRFARAVLAAADKGRDASTPKQTSSMPEPSRASDAPTYPRWYNPIVDGQYEVVGEAFNLADVNFPAVIVRNCRGDDSLTVWSKSRFYDGLIPVEGDFPKWSNEAAEAAVAKRTASQPALNPASSGHGVEARPFVERGAERRKHKERFVSDLEGGTLYSCPDDEWRDNRRSGKERRK